MTTYQKALLAAFSGVSVLFAPALAVATLLANPAPTKAAPYSGMTPGPAVDPAARVQAFLR